MENKEYEQKKKECWEEFCKQDNTAFVKVAFNYAFDRAYSLGKQEKDAEGEEMLTVEADLVKDLYQRAKEIEEESKRIHSPLVAAKYRGVQRAIEDLFGSKCLPDVANEDNFAKTEPTQFFESDYSIGDKVIVNISSIGEPRKEVVTLIRQYQPQCDYNDYKKSWVIRTENGQTYQSNEAHFEPYEEPKPAEPKFKKGDKVRFKRVYTVGSVDDGQVFIDSAGNSVDEDCLEPYTEQEENVNLSQETANCDKQLDNTLKDSFRNERRCNIAVQMIKALTQSPEIVDRISSGCDDGLLDGILHDALYLTDKLIAECEKGGSHEKA